MQLFHKFTEPVDFLWFRKEFNSVSRRSGLRFTCDLTFFEEAADTNVKTLTRELPTRLRGQARYSACLRCVLRHGLLPLGGGVRTVCFLPDNRGGEQGSAD
jgi:hypothetical protein